MDIPDDVMDRDDVLHLKFYEKNSGEKEYIDQFPPKSLKILSTTSIGYLFPYDVLEANNLKVLELTDSNLKQFPRDIDKLDNLEYIAIINGEIHDLPINFCNLKNLESLIINKTPLTELPDNFGKLTSLRELDLQCTNLNSLPDSFAQLTNLEKLNLEGCKFREFPTVLFELPSLSKINLKYNSIEHFAEDFNVDNSIVTILLKDNLLEKLPKKITKLKRLEYINLDHNPISKGEISKFKSLSITNKTFTRNPGRDNYCKSLAYIKQYKSETYSGWIQE